MDSVIVAALITAAATILAALLHGYLGRRRPRELSSESVQGLPQGPPAPSETVHQIERDFVVGVLLTLLLAVIFGMNHVLGRHVISTSSVNPLLVAAGRNFASGLFILLFAIVLQHFESEPRRKIALSRDSALMVLGRTTSSLFYFLALVYLTATSTITLYKLNTIYTFIILLFLIKRVLPTISVANILIGMIVAISGSVVTIIGFNRSESVETNLSGILFVILAGFFWSVYIVHAERYSSRHPEQATLCERQRYVGYIYLLSSLPLVLIVAFSPFFASGQYATYNISIADTGKIIALGCISGTIGILYFEALKRISSLLVGVIVSLEIFFTMIFERLFLEQEISWNLFLGAVLVIVGSVSVGRESTKLKL